MPARLLTGKKNEATENQQVCVTCLGSKVETCSICQGTGEDPYASLVKGVREMTGEAEAGGDSKILVEVHAAAAKLSARCQCQPVPAASNAAPSAVVVGD